MGAWLGARDGCGVAASLLLLSLRGGFGDGEEDRRRRIRRRVCKGAWRVEIERPEMEMARISEGVRLGQI